ncbi:hypothetical protein C0J52_28071 [Blattella germanica]|nr:hypothetical protein C0J52_28071 [Blattella germanica]
MREDLLCVRCQLRAYSRRQRRVPVSHGMSPYVHPRVWVRRGHLHQPLHHENDVMQAGEDHPQATLWRMCIRYPCRLFNYSSSNIANLMKRTFISPFSCSDLHNYINNSLIIDFYTQEYSPNLLILCY